MAWTTRLGVLLVAVFAVPTLGPASGGPACENEPATPLAAAYLIVLAAYAGWLALIEGYAQGADSRTPVLFEVVVS